MGFIHLIGIYSLVALGVSWTTYITIFRPTVAIVNEVLEYKPRSLNGFIGFILWTALAFILAPFTTVLILVNDNNFCIQTLAADLIEKLGDDEEE